MREEHNEIVWSLS